MSKADYRLIPLASLEYGVTAACRERVQLPVTMPEMCSGVEAIQPLGRKKTQPTSAATISHTASSRLPADVGRGGIPGRTLAFVNSP